ETVPFDAPDEVIGGRQDKRDINAERTGWRPGRPLGARPVLVGTDALGAPAEQGDRAAGVAAAGVGQPDRDLGQALPQVTFLRRAGFPGRPEPLVPRERTPLAEPLV